MISPNLDHVSAASSAEIDPEAERRAELAALVDRATRGQPAAQTELVQRYTRRISGFVRTFVRSPDAAEDVTQTVFIKMFQRLARLRDAAAFESWLFMLARNTALDFLRRQRRRPATVALDAETFEIAAPATNDSTREIRDALDLALEELAPQTRTLVSLFVEGHSYDTMARREGLTLGAVKARLHRARPLLRERVGGAIEGRRIAA